MVIHHLSEKDYQESSWSGGTTTELFIFPPSANYKKRQFDFRISSATVCDERSVFTHLEGVWRYITPLQGSFTLAHEGYHTTTLMPLEIDSFSGEWNTVCDGKAIDFNLMLKGNCQGVLQNILPSEGGNVITPRGNHSFEGFYFLRNGKCMINRILYHVSAGDLLIIELFPSDPTVAVALPQSKLLNIQIWYF